MRRLQDKLLNKYGLTMDWADRVCASDGSLEYKLIDANNQIIFESSGVFYMSIIDIVKVSTMMRKKVITM